MDWTLEGMEEEAREGVRRDFDGVLDWVRTVRHGEGNGFCDAIETNKNDNTMETKFKVGDKVRLKKYEKLEWEVAAFGDDYYTLRCVKADDVTMIDVLSDLKFSDESEVELVEERKEYKEGEERVLDCNTDYGFELYRSGVNERVEFGYFEKGYECKVGSGLEFLVRRAEDKYVCRELRKANEVVVMSVSYDGEGLDCVLSMDEAEQLALVLQQKASEARLIRGMEVNK